MINKRSIIAREARGVGVGQGVFQDWSEKVQETAELHGEREYCQGSTVGGTP